MKFSPQYLIALKIFTLIFSSACYADSINKIAQVKCIGEKHSAIFSGLFLLTSTEGGNTLRGFEVFVSNTFPSAFPLTDWVAGYKFEDYSGYASSEDIKKIKTNVDTYNALPCEKKSLSVYTGREKILVCGPGSQIDFEPSISEGIKTAKIETSGEKYEGKTYVTVRTDRAKTEKTEFGTYNACNGFSAPVK